MCGSVLFACALSCRPSYTRTCHECHTVHGCHVIVTLWGSCHDCHVTCHIMTVMSHVTSCIRCKPLILLLCSVPGLLALNLSVGPVSRCRRMYTHVTLCVPSALHLCLLYWCGSGTLCPVCSRVAGRGGCGGKWYLRKTVDWRDV